VDVPKVSPFTMPVVGPTEQTPAGVLVAVQIPPDGELVRVVDAPTQTLPEPEMAAGSGLTLTVLVTKHPLPRSYVMVTVPNETPPTTPVDALTEPTAGLLLLHVPPAGVVESVVVAPRHAMFTPVIAAGVGVTVTTATELQPATV